MSDVQRRVADAVAVVEIRQLMEAYADIVSRRAWGEMAALFTDEATIDLDLRDGNRIHFDGAGAITEFLASTLEGFSHFQFVVLGTRIVPAADGVHASGRMYMSEIRERVGGHWSQIYGTYDDTFRFDGGAWRFATRQYHSVARNNVPAQVFGFPPLPG